MNNRRKYIVTLITILISLAFTGCFKAVVSGTIDENYMATYQCNIEVNLSGAEYSQQSLTQESLLKLSEYWQSIGYESQVAVDGETYFIYYKKQVQCQSYEQAFEELFKLMTDEHSPFQDLSYLYTSYTNYSEYQINGQIDISQSLDMEVYNSLQEDLKQEIDAEMQNLNASIVFTFPNQDNLSQPSSMTKSFSTPILANQATTFSFSGKVNNPNVVSGNVDTISKYNNYNTLKYMLAFFFIVLALLTVYMLMSMKKNK